MKKHGNRILSLVLIFLVILGGVIFPAKANADESVVGDKTVRVGFYVIDGYQYYNDSGEEAGFGVEYLKNPSQAPSKEPPSLLPLIGT